MPTDAVSLILWLANLGITLSEQDQQKIHDKVLADKQAADAETERSESLDAPMDGGGQ